MFLEQMQQDIIRLDSEIKKINAQLKSKQSQTGKLSIDHEFDLMQKVNDYTSEMIRLKALLVLKKQPKSYTSFFPQPANTKTNDKEQLESPSIALKSIIPSKEVKPKPPNANNTDSPVSASKSIVFRYYSHCKKVKRDTKTPRSLFYLHSDDGKPDINFAMEHDAYKLYPRGFFSLKVKKGYIGQNTEPAYAIKVFEHGAFEGGSIEEKRVAMRGAYCSRLLGRTGQTFCRNGKEYLVTDWISGNSLSKKIMPEILRKIPISQRIAMAMDLIRDLAILHENGFIHCDVKPGNALASDTNLKLIDLDSVKLKHDKSITAVTVTKEYLDEQLNRQWENGTVQNYLDEKSDLFAAGLTIGRLFPELFEMRLIEKTGTLPHNPSKSFKFNQRKLFNVATTKEHDELMRLIFSITSENRNQRPNSAHDLYNLLGELNRKQYNRNYDKIQFLAKDKTRQTGEQAYAEIENEINNYDYTSVRIVN